MDLLYNKTVTYFLKDKPIHVMEYSNHISFEDLVSMMWKQGYMGYDRVLIQEWKDGQEIKCHGITYANPKQEEEGK